MVVLEVMMTMMMIILNFLCRMVDNERRLGLFSAGINIRDPHHRESPTRYKQGLNLRRT